MTRVINIKSCKPIDLENLGNNYVYCGRKDDVGYMHYGNPLRISKTMTRLGCIEQFRMWLEGKMGNYRVNQRLWILTNVGWLKGKTLGCYCKNLGCHCDLYVEIVEQTTPWGKKMAEMIDSGETAW